ncbi:MAG: hypothetical protein ACKVHP_15955, partial [Verrucomicrobiales bacterium]
LITISSITQLFAGVFNSFGLSVVSMNAVQPNRTSAPSSSAQKPSSPCWMSALKASRDLTEHEMERHYFVVTWRT